MTSAEYGWPPDYILDNFSPAMLNLYMAAAAKRIENYYGGRSSSTSKEPDVVQITNANEGLLAEFGIKNKAVKDGRSK